MKHLCCSQLDCVNLLSYYLSNKSVNDDFDKLCELLISDRLKSALPHGPLNYVLSLEGDEWFTPDRVAYLADTFVNNRALLWLVRHRRGAC